MARRKGFLARFFDTLKNAFEATPTPKHREAQRRREARDFARGKRTSGKAAERYAQQRRDARATRNAQAARARREKRQADPFEREWRRQMPGKRINRKDFETHKRLFMDIPHIRNETPEEKAELWESYIENMVYGRHGYRFNDPRNPFWDDIAMQPRDFDWSEWRRRRKTP